MLLRRLFERIDDGKGAAIDAYQRLWREHREALAEEAARPETAQAFAASYPLHPGRAGHAARQDLHLERVPARTTPSRSTARWASTPSSRTSPAPARWRRRGTCWRIPAWIGTRASSRRSRPCWECCRFRTASRAWICRARSPPPAATLRPVRPLAAGVSGGSGTAAAVGYVAGRSGRQRRSGDSGAPLAIVVVGFNLELAASPGLGRCVWKAKSNSMVGA